MKPDLTLYSNRFNFISGQGFACNCDSPETEGDAKIDDRDITEFNDFPVYGLRGNSPGPRQAIWRTLIAISHVTRRATA